MLIKFKYVNAQNIYLFIRKYTRKIRFFLIATHTKLTQISVDLYVRNSHHYGHDNCGDAVYVMGYTPIFVRVVRI